MYTLPFTVYVCSTCSHLNLSCVVCLFERLLMFVCVFESVVTLVLFDWPCHNWFSCSPIITLIIIRDFAEIHRIYLLYMCNKIIGKESNKSIVNNRWCVLWVSTWWLAYVLRKAHKIFINLVYFYLEHENICINEIVLLFKYFKLYYIISRQSPKHLLSFIIPCKKIM